MSLRLSQNAEDRLRYLRGQPLQGLSSLARKMIRLDVEDFRHDVADAYPEYREDAAESLWFIRELENLDKKLYRMPMIPMVGRQVVPVDRSIPEWADIHRWRELSEYGEPSLITSYSNAVPLVQTSAAEYFKELRAYALGWAWSMKDIDTSARTNVPLSSMLPELARNSMERKIDRVLLLGDTATGAVGFLKMPGVPVLTPSTKTGGGTAWSAAATGLEIVSDIRAGADSIRLAMGGGDIKVNVQLDITSKNRLDAEMTGLTGSGGKTIKQYIMDNLGDKISKIIESPRCATAGVGNVKRAMFSPDFRSEQEALTWVFGLLNQEFKVWPGQWQDLQYKQIATAQCGGVGCRNPQYFAYMDNI